MYHIYRSKNNHIMIGEINQSNLYLILPGKVSWMTCLMLDHHEMSLIDAIKAVYQSETYRQLEQEDTKMWHLGPVDLYNDMKNVGTCS